MVFSTISQSIARALSILAFPSLLAFTSLLQSCGKGESPVVDPNIGKPVTREKITVVFNVSKTDGSSITFSKIQDKSVAENDANGIGYLMDFLLDKSPLTVSTSPQPAGVYNGRVFEKPRVEVNETNLQDTKASEGFKPINANEKLMTIYSTSGSFTPNAAKDVVAIEVINTDGQGIPVKNLFTDTVLAAVKNSKYNAAKSSINRTITVANPNLLLNIKP